MSSTLLTEDTGVPFHQLQAEQKKKAELEQERERMKVGRGYAEGKMSSMDRVLEGLVAREKEIAHLEAEIDDLELNKKAAALAAGIFRTMASDAGAMLTSLAAEMQVMFEGLLALPRTVEVGGFDSASLQAMDAGGVLRGVGGAVRAPLPPRWGVRGLRPLFCWPGCGLFSAWRAARTPNPPAARGG